MVWCVVTRTRKGLAAKVWVEGGGVDVLRRKAREEQERYYDVWYSGL